MGIVTDKTKRILIIDDDVQILKFLYHVLVREGYQVIMASNGKEGIMLYREDPVDLVITDLIMPDKEGIETINELKKDFPSIKIIAMSGGGYMINEDYLYIAEKFGAKRTLAKPFERDELVGAVKELL